MFRSIDSRKFFSPRYLTPIVVFFWSTVGIFALHAFPGLEALELQIQTSFFQLRGQQAPPQEVIILAIDELSLNQGESYDRDTRPYLEPLQRYPWKRRAYAQVIERLMQAGAKVVGVDVLFVQPSIYGAQDDQELQTTLVRYADRLVLAASYESSDSQEGELIKRLSPVDILPQLPSSVEGFVNLSPASDRTIRQLGRARAGERTFATAILQQGGTFYPPPQGSQINYLGPAGTWIRSGQQYPLYFVLDPQNWRDVLLEGKVFEDKIVLIGATASSLQDIQPSALGVMPGVEIHANSIATLMNGQSIRTLQQTFFQEIFLLIWSIVLGGCLAPLRRSQHQFLLAILLSLALGLGCFLGWSWGKFYVPIGLSLVSAWGMGTTFLVTGVIKEQVYRRQVEAEKQKLRNTLELYVAAPIVGEILNQPEAYYALISGKSIEAVVMFSDIRGFTTLSTLLPPRDLVQQLNIYLAHMVEVIIECQGTVDKFIGDAIMAEFGSPLSRGAPTDVMLAIKAALGMRKALHALRKEWIATGKKPFFHGIGLHFGEVIVGNIGSPRRLEYAVIGDTVNVASRIEGLTKSLGWDILLSQAIYDQVKDQIEVVDLGEQELRGRSGGIRLYGLIGLKSEPCTLYQEVQQEWCAHQAKKSPLL